MKEAYELTDFVYDEELKLFRYPEGYNYSYSDGDRVEKKIYNTLKKSPDNSSNSKYLKNKIADWPTEYHFSENRHNLIRHLDLENKAVLELGSGCGGITRYLGENSKKVDAIEGSLARAKCVSERCRDLLNVRVFCSDFSKIKADEKYDIVTLIGVAEYAPVFLKTETPFIDYLKIAKSFLKNDGVLVLAIENRLGLKYFAGAPEDHIGKKYYGIMDLYDKNSVVTFGREELKGQITNAGFFDLEFYYPYPDYKLPKVVFSDEAIDNDKINISDILLSVKNKTRHNNFTENFNIDAAWNSVCKNDLFKELSNSFLIKAYLKPFNAQKEMNLVFFYTTDRIEPFNSVTTFIINENDEITTVKKPLRKVLACECGDPVNFTLNRVVSDYHQGQLFDKDFLKCILREDTNELRLNFDVWIKYLIHNAIGEKNSSDIYLSIVKNEYFDCLPFNLIKTSKGFEFIDREWESGCKITLYQIILRYVLILVTKYDVNFNSIFKNKGNNFYSLIRLLDIPYLKKEILNFEKLLGLISKDIFGVDSSFRVSHLNRSYLIYINFRKSITNFVLRIISMLKQVSFRKLDTSQ
jgi:2-polyprenyl-3-methyl-5-hydroxy-6-metoxy-1,4-benzoquinol methylase